MEIRARNGAPMTALSSTFLSSQSYVCQRQFVVYKIGNAGLVASFEVLFRNRHRGGHGLLADDRDFMLGGQFNKPTESEWIGNDVDEIRSLAPQQFFGIVV